MTLDTLHHAAGVLGANIHHITPPTAGPNEWDWTFAWNLLPYLLRGLWITVKATLVGISLAMVLGLALAIARRSKIRLISWPVAAFIEFVRSTPLLAQLYVLFFVLPDFGIVLSAFTAGAIGLGVHYGTYTSEAYRAGIENVPRGQWEASTALNLTASQTWRHVILPQAIPTVIPALGNYVVAMFKDAPLLSAITLVELVGVAKQAQKIYFRGLEAFTMAGVLFLAVSIPASIGVRYLERRYGYERT